MIAAESTAPETSRSLRGVDIQDPPANVEIESAADLPAWVHPISTSAPLIRVARWMQHATKGDIDLGPGATSTHVALMFAVGQYQGQNDYSTAGQRTLATAAWTVERAARMGLEELVAHGWLTRADDPPGSVARYAVAMAPGKPIPARKLARRTPAINSDPPAFSAAPEAITAGVGPAFSAGDPGNKVQGPRHSVPGTPAINADKKTIQEITEKTSEKTVAQVCAGARTCETTSSAMPMTLPLFRESTPTAPPPEEPKPSRAAKPPKAPKPPPAPKATELYSAAYVAGQTDAEPQCGFRPLGESDCRLLGATAATHARDPETGAPVVGEALLVWIRKTAAEFRRAGEPAYSKGYAVHAFATWLDSGRPKTRKAPLPPPPEPPRPPREIPPPRPIPEIFMECARADMAKGLVHPLIQRLEEKRKAQKPEST